MSRAKLLLLAACGGALFGALVLGVDSLTETDSVLTKISMAVHWPVVQLFTPHVTGDRDRDYRLWASLVLGYWAILGILLALALSLLRRNPRKQLDAANR